MERDLPYLLETESASVKARAILAEIRARLVKASNEGQRPDVAEIIETLDEAITAYEKAAKEHATKLESS